MYQKLGFKLHVFFKILSILGQKRPAEAKFEVRQLWKFYIPILLFSKEHFKPSFSTLRALTKKLGFKLHVFLIFSIFHPIFDRKPLGRLLSFGPNDPKMLPDLFFRSYWPKKVVQIFFLKSDPFFTHLVAPLFISILKKYWWI